MPRRRQRDGLAPNAPRAASGSPELEIGHKEFSELKDSVQNIFARLEVLEKVFVFVDFEQINDVLAKYQTDVPVSDKAGIDTVLDAKYLAEVSVGDQAGIDTVLTDSKWEGLPVSGSRLDTCIPEDMGDCDNCEKALAAGLTADAPNSTSPHSVARQSSRLSLRELVKAQREAVADDTRRTVGSQGSMGSSIVADDMRRPVGSQGSAGSSRGFDSSRELKHCIWEGPASAMDEDEQKSTCSTWDLCSTRDGLDGEADVEPELFNKFMMQALRPSWESKMGDTSERHRAWHQ